MDRLRTPDDRFTGLPDFDFAPHYAEVADPTGGDALRVAYLDEGPEDADPVVLLHGEPTLVVPVPPCDPRPGRRRPPGRRAGPGRLRSIRQADAARASTPTPATSSGCARLLFERLGLSGVTLFGQDWGGLLGLRLVGEHPERFARVAIGNGGPADRRPAAGRGVPRLARVQPERARAAGRGDRRRRLRLRPRARGGRRLRRPVPRRVLQGGRAPVPGARADGARRPGSRRQRRRLGGARRPSTVRSCAASATATRSPAAATVGSVEHVPGARDREHVTIEGAGHFLQEDRGELLGAVLAAFIAATP